MSWTQPLAAGTTGSPELLGAKAHGLCTLLRLGLPVPEGFVVDSRACRAFLRDGRFPAGLDEELAAAARGLTRVSVRSGAAVSMPGMMSTVLDLDLTADAAADRLRQAVCAVFRSWHTPRATTYRELHGIPHDLGTAVVVQTMVFGDRDEHSGSGVAFSRDPHTGEHLAYGDVLFGHRGDDVVSGDCTTRPLPELADREPAVWQELTAALHRIERHLRDACHVEFTYESGRLWLLQVRAGGFTGRAAIRVAVDFADEGLIDRRTAVRRISPTQLRRARVARIASGDVLARGRAACPGVATGRIAVTADRAARMSAEGPVILVRPATSPLDMHGLAAAAGIVTSRGGPTSHAAVVARAMGKPAVVGATRVTVEAAGIRIDDRTVPEGTLITIDGTGGEIMLGLPAGTTAPAADDAVARLLGWADDITGDHSTRSDEDRLRAAHAKTLSLNSKER
jgi:pyruvate, orthophosphate dikinase